MRNPLNDLVRASGICTEDAPANAADYLEITEVGLYRGWSQREWHEGPNERSLCNRFCAALVMIAPLLIPTRAADNELSLLDFGRN